MRTLMRSSVARLVLLSLCLWSGSAVAGLALDTTYGTAGRASLSFGGGRNSFARLAVIDSSGRILVAGSVIVYTGNRANSQLGLARLTSAGAPDPSFDGDGYSIFSFFADQSSPYAIALQPDGKILVAVTHAYSSTPPGRLSPRSAFYITIIRLLADGTPDVSFDGDGFASVSPPPGGVFDPAPDPVGAAVNAMVLRPDGHILIAGGHWNAGRPNPTAMVVALNADGTLDTTFGNGGYVESARPESHFLSLSRLTDGSVLLGGWSREGPTATSWDLLFEKLQSGGSPDPTFGVGGVATLNVGDLLTGSAELTTDQVHDFALRPDGRIVAAIGYSRNFGTSSASSNAALASFSANGALDTSFGSGGFVRLLDTELIEHPTAIELLANGESIVGGYRMPLTHVSADGKAVSEGPTSSQAGSLVLQGQGRALIAQIEVSGVAMGDFTTLRYDISPFSVAVSPGGGPAAGSGGGSMDALMLLLLAAALAGTILKRRSMARRNRAA
jgi:uncharacterized delta-60 repeat protein